MKEWHVQSPSHQLPDLGISCKHRTGYMGSPVGCTDWTNCKKRANMRQYFYKVLNNVTVTIKYYIFKRNAGLSFGCWVIFADISFAISSASSGLSDLVTTLQITVKMHSRSGVENRNLLTMEKQEIWSLSIKIPWMRSQLSSGL